MNTQDAKKAVHPAITILTFILSSGALWTAVGAANDIENEQIRQAAEQEQIVKNQDEFKEEFKEYQVEQRAVQTQQMQLLHQIKGKLEAQ